MCGHSTLDEVAVDEVVKLDLQTPEGVELKVDRVDKEFNYTYQIHVGETVRFSYSAGSEYGVRTVLVLKVYNNGLDGLTLERDGGYRRYLDVNISGNITVVKPFVTNNNPVSSGNVKRVRFDDAGQALLASLSGEQLAELYDKYVALEGDGAEFDSQTGEVVVMIPAPKLNQMVTPTSNNDLEIVNKNGKRCRVWFYRQTLDVGIEVSGGIVSNNMSIETFRDELVKFLA